MTEPNPARALRELVDEVKQDATPDVDWDRVERRVMQQVARTEPIRAQRRWPVLTTVAAVAAAALVGLGVAELGSDEAPPAAPRQAATQEDGRAIDGDRLQVGSLVRSGAHPRVVRHAGRASWTLEPNSRARLRAAGEPVVVELLSGAVQARVVPSMAPESFAIDVADTRVSVHGTVFRVQLAENQVHVTVDEGAVRVRPKSASPAAGSLLRAPAQGQFDLNGVPAGTASAAGPSAASVADTTEPAPPEATPKPSARAPVLPIQPSANAIDEAFGRTLAVLQSCFKEHTEVEGDMRVTVRTLLTMQVDKSGQIASLSFSPPLAPRLQQCSARATSAVTLPKSRKGTTVTRTVHLDR